MQTPEEYEQLNPKEQEEVFHKAPFRERGELLIYSHYPDQLVRSLSREEFYLLTRELDSEERGEVLRHATLPQLFFMSDLDCWKRDQIDGPSFVHWLEALLLAGDDKLLAWLVTMDYEMVVSGFKELIRVLKPDWEYAADEILGDQHYFTLDNLYYISVEEDNIETVRRAIEVLFENHRGRYAALLEGLLSEMNYELEEEAYQRRTDRLSERGFPDPESARHIYLPLSKEDFEKFPRKPFEKRNWAGGPLRGYLTTWSRQSLFLDQVLLLFRDESKDVKEGIEEEMAWISNKVIACDGVDFASEERVRNGIERARCLVNIGLEALSGKDLEQAREVLKNRWVEIIFRWGVSELDALRKEADTITAGSWKGRSQPLLEFLGEPYEQIFRGIFNRPVPRLFDPSVSPEQNFFRDFHHTADVEQARLSLREVSLLHAWLSRSFPSFFNRPPPAGLLPVMGTCLAHFTLEEKLSYQRLSAEDLVAFLNRGLSEKEKFLSQAFTPEEQTGLQAFLGILFQRMEEELTGLNPAKKIDPRFISTLHLRPA